MLIPALRTPLEEDIKASLSLWLDESKNNVGFVSSQVHGDLERIASLRNSLVQAGKDYKRVQLQQYEEYHAMLLECETRELCCQGNSYVKFPWKTSSGTTVVHSHIAWERANVLWNVATILAYQASIQKKNDKTGWNKAHLLLQEAASVLHHLLQLGEEDMEAESIQFFKFFLLSQAQVATYYMALASPRPRHVVLAKLASAAIPLLGKAHQACQEELHQDHVRAWSTWMMALAQYHESSVHRQKKQNDLELARLYRARDAISTCQEVVYSEDEGMSMLQGEVPKMVRTIRDRLLQLQHSFDGPAATQVKDIRGEVLVKENIPLSKELTTLETPIFCKILPPATGAQQAVLQFQQDVEQLLHDLNDDAEEHMEEARKTLADVNLPHSLTAYKQEQCGGGIPVDLWEKIEALQEEELLQKIKKESWEVQQLSELAMSIHSSVTKQLQEDYEMDRQFREANPRFKGHDTANVHRSFRSSLKKYDTLLSKSRNGDAILMKRLECLDTDPKYKLLLFQKSQLDRLLPAGKEGDTPIDTTQLARLLVALSSLFDEREELLHRLQVEAEKCDIAGKVANIDPKSPSAQKEYDRVIQKSFKSLGGISYDIRNNISRQAELVDSILAENKEFMTARDAGASSKANENCIVMIEDAIEETEQLRIHLHEGREFYNTVIPKLERLQHEVGDASARLAVERCEYEDNSHSRNQESADARLAASLAGNAPSHGESTSSGNATHGGETTSPSDDQPGIVVDDALVANLVAMDFDPEKVVTALKNHNNNMEQALNELLS